MRHSSPAFWVGTAKSGVPLLRHQGECYGATTILARRSEAVRYRGSGGMLKVRSTSFQRRVIDERHRAVASTIAPSRHSLVARSELLRLARQVFAAMRNPTAPACLLHGTRAPLILIDAPSSSCLPRSTDRLDRLGERHHGKPIAIEVKFATAFDAQRRRLISGLGRGYRPRRNERASGLSSGRGRERRE